MAKNNFHVLSQTLWEDGEIATEIVKSNLNCKDAVKFALKKNVKCGSKLFKSGKKIAISTFYVEKKIK